MNDDGNAFREMSRRRLFQTAVLGAGTLSVFGLTGCTGQSKLTNAAKLTSLGQTIVFGPARVAGLPYKRLAQGPGESIVVREELAKAVGRRASTRKALLAFGHITDMHIVDAAAPGRMEFLRPYSDSKDPYLKSAGDWRPQEMLTVQVMDSMIRKLNAIGEGPVGGRKLDFVISTGDTADARLGNELTAAINVLNGKKSTTNVVSTGYEGIQDNEPAPDALRMSIWHPEPVTTGTTPDDWITKRGYPIVPGYLNAAVLPVETAGTAVPWYAGFGNHDALDHGGYGLESPRGKLARMLNTADRLPLSLPPGMSFAEFMNQLNGSDDAAIEKIIAGLPHRKVTAAAERKAFSKQDFVQAHLDNPGPHGLAGHGFDHSNAQNSTAYYRFKMGSGLVGIMLDTTDPAESAFGYLGGDQLAWLQTQLESVSSRSYSGAGDEQHSPANDQLVVIFSHHTAATFISAKADEAAAAGSLSGDDFLQFLGRFPNVIAWVNGHEHLNKIWGHRSTYHGGGFWEINTASHIDYPQQSRIIEILDNEDGTLSIFTVLFDHADLSQLRYDGTQTPASLAALSLELAMNQPGIDLVEKTGKAVDRNVELLLTKPFGS